MLFPAVSMLRLVVVYAEKIIVEEIALQKVLQNTQISVDRIAGLNCYRPGGALGGCECGIADQCVRHGLVVLS
ncbi:hypothetical protein A7317_21790 [Pseudomonas fluorescens]|nr:hypothetical protein A7317_21790 [Pseudomonas fluorescens]AOE75236.1 hypothetical protein A7319_21215 [Pseudomonas fluorescens]